MTNFHFEAVIFDFDGTICDSVNVKETAFGKMYEDYGTDVVKRVKKYHIDNSGVSRIDKFLYYQKHVVHEDYSEYKINELSRKFSSLVSKKVIEAPLISGALEFLEKNFNSTHLYLSSATPQQELEKIVKNKNLSNYFQSIFGSPKDKIKHIEEILSLGSHDIDKAVYVGDSVNDLIAAKAANISFIGVGKENFGEEFLSIDDLTELEDILKERAYESREL